MKKDHYKELRKKYSDKEIAEDFILPGDMSPQEQEDLNSFFHRLKESAKHPFIPLDDFSGCPDPDVKRT